MMPRIFTEEHKQKIRDAVKRTKNSVEWKETTGKIAGENISKAKKGKPSWNKGKKCPWAKFPRFEGANHPNWKGGLVMSGGYAYIYKPELGTCFGGKYIKRANLVWFERTGEVIKAPFCLHHKDHNRLNDDFFNLLKIELKEHIGMEGNLNNRNENGQFIKKGINLGGN